MVYIELLFRLNQSTGIALES